MADEIVIRDLRPDDVEAAVDIALAAWVPVFDSFRRMMGEEVFAIVHPDWRAEKARQVRDGCDPKHGGMHFVAELGGEVVGFITSYPRRRTGIGEIGNNAVHPDCQRRGIATRLYRHVLQRLREAGMRVARVTTGGDPSHAPARRAYEKAGFSSPRPDVTYYCKL